MDLKLVLHRTIIKSGKRSMVKNQSFKARQVDVTANSQRLSNPLYIGIKTWRIHTIHTHIQGQYSLCKMSKTKHQQLREFFQLFIS